MHAAFGLGVADDCCRFGTVAFAFVPSIATNFLSFISECLRIKFAESMGLARMDSASKAEHDLARWLEECQVGPGGRWSAQGLAEKADTAILIRMERLGVQGRKDLLNNASVSEKWGGLKASVGSRAEAPTPVQGGDTLRIPRATGGVGPQCLFYSCDCFVLLL